MKLYLPLIATFALVFSVGGLVLILYSSMNKVSPISCNADKILIAAKNGYFCVENAFKIQ